MDITELILSDHHEQRRMFALLDDLKDGEAARLEAVWRRLQILLEVHAAAEEALFYPRLLEVGVGVGGKPDAGAETLDAVHDHNEIRDAIAEVSAQQVGTDQWWSGIAQVREANSDHMGEEEREALADFRRCASLAQRHEIAVAFAAFEAEHASGIEAKDKDPKRYVADNR